jgi:hypothetical protein
MGNYYSSYDVRRSPSFTLLVARILPDASYHVALSSHSGSGSKDARIVSSSVPEFRIYGISFFEKRYTVGAIPSVFSHESHWKVHLFFLPEGPPTAVRSMNHCRSLPITVGALGQTQFHSCDNTDQVSTRVVEWRGHAGRWSSERPVEVVSTHAAHRGLYILNEWMCPLLRG